MKKYFCDVTQSERQREKEMKIKVEDEKRRKRVVQDKSFVQITKQKKLWGIGYG